MNLNNFLTLTIRCQDFNLVATNPTLLKKLRSLTLEPYSGMNYELNHLERTSKVRPVKCNVLLAYRSKELIGWALLSKETSNYRFSDSAGYHSGMGTLFQIYIHHEHRRQGIGTELIKVARKKANSGRLCVAAWDIASEKFFGRFDSFKTKHL